ncbi:MAG: WbqC family protein [Thermodesulfobacteriota bacterium]
MKRLAIIQPNYIPWKGYFDIINAVDEFILYDTVQYTRGSWRNRNRIKTENGLLWLTIPVRFSLKQPQDIADVVVSDPHWARRHWKSITQTYGRFPHFPEIGDALRGAYARAEGETLLSRIDQVFLEAVMGILGISTPLVWSSEYGPLEGDATDKVVQLCARAGAGAYVTGPAARDYLEVARLAAAGCAVRWVDYSGYPAYEQGPGPFEHGVSIVDMLARLGVEACRRCMLSFPESGRLDHLLPRE